MPVDVASGASSPSLPAASLPGGADPHDFAEYIPFDEFRNGLPSGRFRVIVNPSLAPRFLTAKLNVLPVTIAVIGLGIAAALAGHAWLGAGMVFTGVLLRRWLKRQAGPVLVFLASRVLAIYESATESGVMEVQRAA